MSATSGKRFGLGTSANDARLERVKGIEPSYAAWEAAVLPLNYTRIATDQCDRTHLIESLR